MRVHWEKSGNVAQITVAVLALATLVYSVYQNAKTSEKIAEQNTKIAKFLDQAGEAFLAQSYPVVKHDSYHWDGPEGFNCLNPAHGLYVHYRNFSGVPVAIENTSLEIKMGSAPLPPPEVDKRISGEAILPPGATLAIGMSGNPLREVYPRLQGQRSSPQLNFDLNITFRSLISGKRYRYTGTVTLSDDCRFPGTIRHVVGPETLTEISTQ